MSSSSDAITRAASTPDTSEDTSTATATRFAANIEASVQRLRATFASGRTHDLAWRRQQLERLLALVNDESEAIYEALAADLGKPRTEAMIGEVAYLSGELKHTLAHLERWAKPRRVGVPIALQPARAEQRPEPYGVALIIGPWNYPVQLCLAPLVGAIAAGNCAVVKPSELTPASAALIGRLLPRYLDGDAVAVVQGGPVETQRLLGERFDYIFYTGGGVVGRIVMQAAAKHLTPVTLELGGKSPCVVCADAPIALTARRLVWGKFFNAGQTCVAPDYLLVERPVAEPLVHAIGVELRRAYGEDPSESADYPRIVNERHHRRLCGLLAGQKIALGGERDEAKRYLAPTVLVDVAPDSGVMQEEIFGPILPVLAVDSVAEAVAFINERPKPLALYVFTADSGQAELVLNNTSSGGAVVNDIMTHLGVRDLPFGGVGESGIGAYHGRATFDAFTHYRSVLHRVNWSDPPLRYAPYSESRRRWLARLL